MKVFVLGLDGLEHSLVEKFDLKNLKQKNYGTVDMSGFTKYYYTSDLVYSTVVWASFITGQLPEEHGIMVDKKYANPVIEMLRNISMKLGLGRIKGKAKLLEDFGLDKKYSRQTWEIDKSYYEKNNIKTIFDLSENTVAFNIPTYTHSKAELYNQEEKRLQREFLSGNINEADYLTDLFRNLDSMYEDAIQLMKKRWDLFMFYTRITDNIIHSFSALDQKMARLWEVYAKADLLAEKLKKASGKSLFLIVSDHGMKISEPKKGISVANHSKRAFYSFNKRLNLENPVTTDFAKIIQKELAK